MLSENRPCYPAAIKHWVLARTLHRAPTKWSWYRLLPLNRLFDSLAPCHCVLHKLLFSADVSLTHSVLSGLYTWNPLALYGNYEPYSPGSSSTTSVGFGFTCGIICLTGTLFTTDLHWMELVLPPPDQLFCRNCLQIQLHHSTGPFLRSFRAWTLVYLSSSALFVWVKSGISSLPGTSTIMSVDCTCGSQHFAPSNSLYRWNVAFTLQTMTSNCGT